MCYGEQLSRSITENVEKLLAVYGARDLEHFRSVADFEAKCTAKSKEVEVQVAQMIKDGQMQAKKIVDTAQLQAEKTKVEMDKWAEEKAQIARTQKFDTSIKLDVGGIHFTTSVTTLCRFPDSMLGAMFSGRHALPKNEDGFFFIDRDGTHFRHILNFLRNPDDFTVDLSPAHKEELRREVKYYILDDVMLLEPPFVPAAETVLTDLYNQQVIVGQNNDGIWYSKGFVNQPIAKTPMKVCSSCHCAVPHVNGYYYIDNFSVGRKILEKQPKFLSPTPCPKCRTYNN
jgi:hypothetical protein